MTEAEKALNEMASVGGGGASAAHVARWESALRIEVKALRKDAERLNCLEAHTKGDVTICAPGTHGGPVDKWLVTFDDAYDRHGAISREHQGDTLREAIDAAMKGKT